MSSRVLIRLAIALGVLVVLWGVVALVRRPPDDRTVAIALPRIDSTLIDTIQLAKGRDTARIVRAANRRWMINGFLASPSAVSDLLRGLADTTRQTELVAESKASHEQLGVAPDSGERVRVVGRGRSLLDIVAGKRTEDYAGVYIRRDGDDAVYALHGSLADPLARAIADWRDKHIVAIAPDSVATVEIKRVASSYTLKRSGSGWAFGGDPAKVDSARVGSFLGTYRDLSASGFPTTAEADSVHFGRNARHVTLLSKAGVPLAKLSFDSTASGTWGNGDSGGPIYKLDAWTWGQLAPPESTLKAKPPAKPRQ